MRTARVHHLDVAGTRVHSVVWTPDGGAREPDPAGRQFLLVHGLGANTLSWQPVGQRLADQYDATVTAIDLVGFGRTRARDREATVEANRELVIEILERTGPATLFGNSMGGVISTGVTARRPDLVEALVLVNPALPWGRIPPSAWLRAARYMPVMHRRLGRRTVAARARMLGPERLVELSLGATLHEPSRLDPELRRRFVLLAAERYAYPEAAAAYADAARTLLQEVSGDFDADLASASAARPTLLIHGAEDQLVSVTFAHAAGARHATIELEVLDDVGHAPQLEVPDRFLDVVGQFLARVADGAHGTGTTGDVSAPGPDGPANGRMGPRSGADPESESKEPWRTGQTGPNPASASSASPSAPSSPH